MKNPGIQKVLNVWESKNKILKPVHKKLYLQAIDQIGNLFSVGSFYYYILNFENLKMEFVHEGTTTVLGLAPNKFTLKKLLKIIHPDDIARMHEKESIVVNFLFNQIRKEDIPLYKVVYLLRLRHGNGGYKTILHQAKALVVSQGGKVQKVLGIHTDVTYLNMPLDHKVSFISHQKSSFYSLGADTGFEPLGHNCKDFLTAREIEILKCISDGMNFNKIAEKLFISPHTVRTHQRNILSKSKCKNTTELVAKCIREGVI